MVLSPKIAPEDRSRGLQYYHDNRERVLERKRKARETSNPWVKRECDLCGNLYGVRQNNTVKRYCGTRCRRRANNLRMYGLSVEDYRTLVGDGRCFICQRKIRKWHVDHDHKTLETWGVICSLCNVRVVSSVRRDADTVRRLLVYIENPPARSIDGQPRMAKPEANSSSWNR